MKPESVSTKQERIAKLAREWQGRRWVLDVDVRKYFASIPHAKLREFLARRVTDGVVRRFTATLDVCEPVTTKNRMP